MLLRFLLSAIFVFTIGVTHAQETGLRSITGYGCHKSDGTCYVLFDGPSVSGGPDCIGNQLRWDAKNDANGKSWLAMIMMAAANGKKVSFFVAGCYSPPFPTFSYGSVEP